MQKTHTDAYNSDLAYIHDTGFGEFARNSAHHLLRLFQQSGIAEGLVVDLGCGSGIWPRELVDSGYQVTGVDISPAMIALARTRVSEAEFHVCSFVHYQIPQCRAVTALGEVFSYLFDPANTPRSLQGVCKRVFDALSPDGLFIFDVAEIGRCQGMTQRFVEGQDWACIVEYRQDTSKQRLSRRIVCFRKVGDTFRRSEETHIQQLYSGTKIAEMLRKVGFRVRQVRSYGKYPLSPGIVAFVARKPGQICVYD